MNRSHHHGFTGQTVVLSADEAEPYRLFTEGFLKDLAPVGVQETQLAHSIVSARWRLQQIAGLEAAVYALGVREHIAQFKDETPELANALARAVTFQDKRKDLDRLHRYESRLHRQATNDEASLLALQTERKARQAAQEKEAVQLAAHFSKLGQSWNPSDFGFVLSIDEIEAVAVRSLDRAAAASAKLGS